MNPVISLTGVNKNIINRSFKTSNGMKFSIIGKGFIMPVHVQAIKDTGGEVVDIVDSYIKDSWVTMVKSTNADCIVILAPNYLHKEIVLESLRNNKIVICEKPLTISSKDCQELIGRKNVFSVLQLRYHPLLKDIKASIKKRGNVINMDVSVYRDADYYASWKGQKEKSGGFLFNLGIHYFDLILYLFGDVVEINTKFIDEKTGSGVIKGNNYICNWHMSTDAPKDNQRRVFEINGINYDFSVKDTNLHKLVYEDLLNSRGITPKECLSSIELIEKLYS